ncbi:hypothetical protein GZ77_04705 [Endozoicomonas montiporae]|uniref:Uncharacterized protein n=2 Tax=Endozoicomonas montiporae TaxID=1027273 RepID=A0A081NBK2_9GAMM|nr:hypothetical protein [Endozoicomonas montiporae]AMO56114.1 hypothetical protein EZMO1_1991 [Endozoicomonas montiporae CL-33]KEQ15825.1 hypothetical protein GZ77_04705 [Endozoicomonas montiporae]
MFQLKTLSWVVIFIAANGWALTQQECKSVLDNYDVALEFVFSEVANQRSLFDFLKQTNTLVHYRPLDGLDDGVMELWSDKKHVHTVSRELFYPIPIYFAMEYLTTSKIPDSHKYFSHSTYCQNMYHADYKFSLYLCCLVDLNKRTLTYADVLKMGIGEQFILNRIIGD